VSTHSQRQGFKPLQNLERCHGCHAGPEVANAFSAGAGDKRLGAKFVSEHQIVKTGIGFGERRKLAAGVPVERTAINDYAAYNDAVSAQEFGGAVNNNIRAMFDGTAQIGRAEGGVDQQGQSGVVGHTGDPGNVEYLKTGIAKHLAKQQPSAFSNGGRKRSRVSGVDKGRGDTKAR